MLRVTCDVSLNAVSSVLSIRGLRAFSPLSLYSLTNMSQTPAPVSMPQTPATTHSESSQASDIESIFDTALKSYKKKTKKDLKNHDIFKRLETCDSPAAILAVFQATEFDLSQTGSDDRLKKWLVPTINVLCAFSDTLGEGVSLVISDSSVPLSVNTLSYQFGRHSHPPKQFLLAWASSFW